MSKVKKSFLIYNPKSGAVKKFPVNDYIQVLNDAGYEVFKYEVASQSHMAQISAEAGSVGCDFIAIAGGDGTLQSLLCSLNGLRMPVIPIPIGTENLFARQMGIKYDINQFREIVLGKNIRQVDLLKFNDTIVTSIAGIGFDAEIVHYMDMRRTSNIKKIHYFVPVVKAIFGFKFPKISVVANGREICNQRAMVFIGNISYYGGGLKIFPEADCTDGKMNVVIYKCCNKLQLTYLFLLTALKLNHNSKLIHRELCESLQITSDTPRVLSQVDGEPGPDLPLDIVVLPKSVDIMVL